MRILISLYPQWYLFFLVLFLSFKNYTHSTGCEVVNLVMVLICISLMTRNVENISWASWLLLSFLQFSSVQLLSRVRLFATPWIAARQAFLSITNSWSSLRLTSIESVMPSSHLILCRPLLLLSTGLKEKHTLEQDEFCVTVSSWLKENNILCD